MTPTLWALACIGSLIIGAVIGIFMRPSRRARLNRFGDGQ